MSDSIRAVAPPGDQRFTLREEREHVASADCWCEPEVDYVDPQTGVAVYVHRDIQ